MDAKIIPLPCACQQISDMKQAVLKSPKWRRKHLPRHRHRHIQRNSKRHPDIHTAFRKNIIKPRKASAIARFVDFQGIRTTSTQNFCRSQKATPSSAMSDQRNALPGITEAQRPKNNFGRSTGIFDVTALFCSIPISHPAYRGIGFDVHRPAAVEDFRSQQVQFAHSGCTRRPRRRCCCQQRVAEGLTICISSAMLHHHRTQRTPFTRKRKRPG